MNSEWLRSLSAGRIWSDHSHHMTDRSGPRKRTNVVYRP